MQVSLLMAYLIAYRGNEVSKGKLIQVLWPADESDNPEGALRNLVYRARELMKSFFPDGTACILSKRNAYYWNPAIVCEVDAEEFEACHRRITTTREIEKKYEACRRMAALYRDDFLAEFSAEEWVIYRAMYYRNLFINCLISTCQSLYEQQQYERIIALCDQIKTASVLDEMVHVYKIRAYIALGKLSAGMEYYRNIVDVNYGRMGVEVPASLRQVYTKMMERVPDVGYDMQSLEYSLSESQSEGAFYCNFDEFRLLYQVIRRGAERMPGDDYLVLFTLERKGHVPASQAEGKSFCALIRYHLRKNDVFTQCGLTHFACILQAPDKEACEQAIRRIYALFEEKKQKGLILSWEAKHIR